MFSRRAPLKHTSFCSFANSQVQEGKHRGMAEAVSVLSQPVLVLVVSERLVQKLVAVPVNAALSGCEKHLDDYEESVGGSLCPSE